MKKRIISMVLVLSMVLTMLPMQVFAANSGQSQSQNQTQTNPFSDVKENDWFYDYVLYALENQLFSGVSSTEFDPQGSMTRAMYVTVMGRIAEMNPEEYTHSGFVDVPDDYWAHSSVAWAKEKSITSGYGDGTFAPNALVTREQMAVFTVRFFEAYQIPFPKTTIHTQPKDLANVADFAKESVLKLWACGLFQGDTLGNFNPKNNATRAEAAAFLTRADKEVENWFIKTGVKENPTTPTVPTRPSGGSSGGSSGGGTSQTYYTYKFVSNGGATVSDRSIAAGKTLDNLPVPYKENAIFVSWCYDEGLTQFVERTDVATGGATLYAKYEATNGLSEDQKVPVAISINSSKDFTITVSATKDLKISDFKALIETENLSSNLDKEWFKIEKSGNNFVITGLNYPLGASGAVNGFVEGSAYKITLQDDSLSFVGQDPTSRVYDFTIAREEILNVSLNNKITEISINDISNLTADGKPADNIYNPSIVVGSDGQQAPSGTSVGTFVYDKGELTVGSTVAIYEGNTAPSLNVDTVVTTDKTGFVVITAKEGTKYNYQVAETEDILFTPDVLPVINTADTDGSSDNLSITVAKSVLDFADGRFADAGLNSDTTVDVGDFIAFYTGTLSQYSTPDQLVDYAEIQTVKTVEDNYVITYEIATLADIQDSMAVSQKESIEGDTLLEGTDVTALENTIARQAQDSGFANDASMYLASLAMETDSFNQLSDEYQLKTFDMKMDGQSITSETLQLMAGGNSNVTVTPGIPKVHISKDLKHFDKSGLEGISATLIVSATIKIAMEDSYVQIDVKGEFEQELSVAFDIGANTEWDMAYIILPRLTACEIIAAVEFYTYTSIDVTANITTQEAGSSKDNIKIEDISEKVKNLLNQEDGEDSKTAADALGEQYASMLENESDWVDIVDQEILKMSFNILYVVDIQIKASFVVSVDMNIALGANFWYENAKLYVYTIDVFEKSVKNSVVDLCPEHYEFEFYVMGTMGLRAGIKLEFAIGILSCDLGSVGFGAEVGAYVRVWGYFYYKLVVMTINDQKDSTTSYSGALLFELGVYLKLTFKAQIAQDRLSYTPTLYEHEWALWHAGHQDNVLDFAYEVEDTPEVALKHYFKATQIPDDIYEMEYLDLKYGLDDNGDYFNKIYDKYENFKVTITNPAFSYNIASNTITVTPDSGSVAEDGELIITWKDRALAFSSAPIERRIPLSWDNLQDGYVIVPYTNGGTYIPIIVKEYNEAITPPQDPTRAGYHFAGWYSDQALTVPYAFPKAMPAESTEIYAKWTPATDTKYTVRYFGRMLGSTQYELMDSIEYQGTTDATVTPEVTAYAGFVAPASKETTILADGSRVVDYYYNRQMSDVTFDPGTCDGKDMGAAVTQSLYYGATITAPQFAVKGYTFQGWDAQVATHMGTTNLTYTATWEKIPPAYRVDYCVMQPDGKYVTQEILFKQATTQDEEIAVSSLNKSDYVVAGVTSYKDVKVNGAVVTDNIPLAKDGSTVIKVYYDRTKYNVTFQLDNDKPDVVQRLYSGAPIVPPTPTKAGYVFAGFGAVAETVGTEDLTYTALWDGADGVSYFVKHIRQDVDGNFPTTGELVETEVKHDGTTGQLTNATEKTYDEFTLADSITQQTVLGDGNTVVEVYYARNTYPVKWMVEGSIVEITDVMYGAPISNSKPEDPTKYGCRFDKWLDWYTDEELTPSTLMGNETKVYSAQFRDLTGDEMDFTLSFDVGTTGAIAPSSINVTYGEPYGDLPEVTVPGYTFDGWFMSIDGYTIQITKNSTVARMENHTLTAKFSPAKYDMLFYSKLGDAETILARTVQGDYNDYITFPVIIESAYTLKGWNVRNSDPDAPEEFIPVIDGEDITRKVPMNGESFDAVWEEKIFTLTVDTKGGTPIAPIQRGYYDEIDLNKLVTTKPGYYIYGWTQIGQSGRVTTINNIGDTKVYTQWGLESYSINYMNSYTTQKPPYSYNIEDETIPLMTPIERDGYTFEGWYTTKDFQEGTEATCIPQGSTGKKTFYAKWTATLFTITFHENVENGGTEIKTVTLESDTIKPIDYPTFGNIPGRKFLCWTDNPEGTGYIYNDLNHIDPDSMWKKRDLYAQWEYTEYTLRCENVTVGATDDPNPEKFTAEDCINGVITLQDPTGIKDPYKFLGWYRNDEKVTTVDPSMGGFIAVKAKWSHPGEFSISTDSNMYDSTRTYTITRTCVANAELSTDPQTVYYRTVNGTAVGSAVPEAAHFVHTDGFVTFESTDGDGSTKTFEVTDISSQNQYLYDDDYYIASAYTANYFRYFNTEIYKIENRSNEDPDMENGVIVNGVCKNELSQPVTARISDVLYQYKEISTAYADDTHTVTNVPYEGTKFLEMLSSEYTLNGSELSYNQIQDYVAATASLNALRLKMSFDARNTVGSPSTYFYYLTDGTQYATSSHDFTSQVISYDHEQMLPVYWRNLVIRYGGSGDADDRTELSNTAFELKVLDEIAPEQVGIAPLAFGTYKRGDSITISVVYNEIIANANGATLGAIDGLNLKDVTYVCGENTNVLVFTATVDQDTFVVDADSVNALMAQKPVDGNVLDMCAALG